MSSQCSILQKGHFVVWSKYSHPAAVSQNTPHLRILIHAFSTRLGKCPLAIELLEVVSWFYVHG